MPKDTKNINKQIAKGSAWMGLFKILEKSISIVSTLILARLLVPADFGVVAMAMMVVAFLELMKSFGFEAALIQNQDATREHYNTAWTFFVITNTLIAVFLLITATPVAEFYNDERLAGIMPVLAIGVFITGFENIAIVNFRKELRFRKDFQFLLWRKIINFVCVISLTLYYHDYWGLVTGYALSQFGIVIMSYIILPYAPRITIAKFKDMIGFSGWVFINNLLRFGHANVSALIIGKMAGAAPLGLFNMARDLTKLTSHEIVTPINRAAFPGYAKLKHDLLAFQNSYLNTIGMIALIIIPASVGFSAIASAMVPVLLGNKWIESIRIMEILAFAGLVAAFSNIFSAYLALGKAKILTAISALRVAITVPFLYYATRHYGVEGAAWAMLVTGIIVLPVAHWPLMRILQIPFYDLASRVIRPALAAGCMYFISQQLKRSDVSAFLFPNQLVELIILVVVGALSYGMTILILWWVSGRPEGSEKQLISAVVGKLSRR